MSTKRIRIKGAYVIKSAESRPRSIRAIESKRTALPETSKGLALRIREHMRRKSS